jgi:hypothetical protein
MGTSKRLCLKHPNPEEQVAQDEKLRVALHQANEEVRAAVRDFEYAHRREAEVREITNRLAPHESVPDLSAQEQVVATRTAQVNAANPSSAVNSLSQCFC